MSLGPGELTMYERRRRAKATAYHHAALAVDGALAAGWPTLDRYADRQLVEEALEELAEDLRRRSYRSELLAELDTGA